MRNYQHLEAWKASMLLVKEVYTVAKAFPKDEIFGLTAQAKRAAVSVPSNIAEGLGRQYKKDTLQFLHIARGSLYELETILNIATMVGIIDETQFARLFPAIDEASRLLSGFINYIEKSDLK